MSIEANTTHLWIRRPGPVTGPPTPAEVRRLAAVTHPRRAQEVRWTGAWLRSVLASYLDTDPLDLDVQTGPHGKPYLTGYDLQFSLSHTRGLWALAVSDRPVGVDVEQANRPSSRAVRRCCSPRERRWLDTRPDLATATWTVKEAYAKALGGGHQLTFSALETHASANSTAWRVGTRHDLAIDVERLDGGHVLLALARSISSPCRSRLGMWAPRHTGGAPGRATAPTTNTTP